MTKFEYNGIIYETWNLRKELKKLGITKCDILIIPEEVKLITRDENEPHIKLYKFVNAFTGEIINSIYPNLNHLVFNAIDRTGICEFNIEHWQLTK